MSRTNQNFGSSGGVSAFVTRIGAPPAAQPSLAVAGFPSAVTAGVAGTVTVTARHAAGNVIADYAGTVHFTSSDPQAVLPADYAFTAADQGQHTFSVTLKTAGTRSLTVADTGTATLVGIQSGIQVNPAAATRLALSGPTSVAINTAFSLTVTALDAYGNVATGYRGQVRITCSDSRATLPANYTFVAGDLGVHTFAGLKFKTRGIQTITLTEVQFGTILGSWTINAT